MYWYDFGRNDVYVGNGGKFRWSDCKTISAEEKERVVQFFSEHLLKVYYTDERSYDSSDDERASDSYSSHSSYVYREMDTEQEMFGVVMHGGEIVGVAFFKNPKSGSDVYVHVFNFSGTPKNYMTLGYSASHSSSYTTVVRVELVKKGEGGAPESASKLSMIQHEMYPSI